MPESSSPPAVVHDLQSCREERRAALLRGAFIGAVLALVFSIGAGIGAARYQEHTFDQQMRIVQAMHEQQLRQERARVARYAEIDALATAYDAALAGR